jgi:1,5-anhydro-D-fructose reductase (1,5-anhydro-D-mannitol-forming)
MAQPRVGIIGYGKMGRLRHKVVSDSGLAQVVAIYDPFATPLCDDPDIRVASSWQDVVADPSIDAVFVATVNAYNKEITIAALKAGKHVFCEKPPALTALDVEDIILVEREARKRLMYGFNHRQHGAALHMRDIVSSGAYGRILWMRGRYGKSVDKDYLDTWRADPKLAGGGILLDQGIHMLDLFLYLGGPFDEVMAMVSSMYWEIPGIEDNVFALLRNSHTGCTASLHSTMTQWRHLFSLEVFMEQGYMVLNGIKTSSDSYGKEELVIATNRSKAPAATWEQEEKFIYDTDTSWNREVEQFFGSIQTGRPVTNGSSRHALEVMKVLDRIYEFERHEAKTLYRDLNAQDGVQRQDGSKL